MSTTGQLKEFDPDNEKVTEYLEHFFMVNSIANDKPVASASPHGHRKDNVYTMWSYRRP